MYKYIFIIIIFSFSCSKSNYPKKYISDNYFIHKNMEIIIPSFFKKDGIIQNKWVDKYNGATLNIIVEYSDTDLSDYLNDSLVLIKKTYSSYNIISKESLSKNKILILSSTKIDDIMLNFYTLVVSFDTSKLIITLGGKKEIFKDKKYETFIKSIKVNEDIKYENNK